MGTNLANTKDNSLFISYSREDSEWAVFAEKEINRTDYDVWWDRKLKVGQDWWRTLCEHIRRCQFFLFVLTPDSLSSIYCNAEMGYALALNKPVIPIIPEYCNEIEVPIELSRIQCKRVVEPEYFLYILEAGLCDIRLAIAVEGKYAFIDLPIPDLPKLSKLQVFEAWEQIEDCVERADTSTANKLCDQIIYSDPDGLGPDAKKRKIQLERDVQKLALYKKIKNLVDENKLHVANPLWKDFRREHTNYDPDSLVSIFSSTILDEASLEKVKAKIVDFDE